ncbi:MAG TPA: hypothetical protein VIG24_16935 [Acidimicrobiia bacterium]
MKDAYIKLRPACDFAGVLSADASIGVVNGRFEAFNKNLMASIPVEGVDDFAVAAVDFDFAMRKHDELKAWRITDANVILDGKTRVKRTPERTALKRPDIKTKPIPNLKDFLDALDDVLPFTMGDKARAWSEGARFDGTKITATNSVVLLQAELAQHCGLSGVTISRSAIAYMSQRRAELEAWGMSERGLMLEFTDGSWALAARMSMEMPDAAVTMVDNLDYSDLPELDIEDAGRILHTIGWSDDIVTIFPDKVYAGRYSTDHDEVVEIDLGEAEKAIFGARALEAVILKAVRVGFNRFPNPVPFVTKRDSKGLIAGRSK